MLGNVARNLGCELGKAEEIEKSNKQKKINAGLLTTLCDLRRFVASMKGRISLH